MSTAPTLTLRRADTPATLLTSIPYVQTAPSGDILPVNEGEVSDAVAFRVYNNYALAAGVASAVNIYLTVYDGSGAGSHTCRVLPVSQAWISIQEYGYGENSVTSPDRFTTYLGTNTNIGGNNPCGSDKYVPEYGSAGTSTPQIRAFSTGNGQGFLQFQTTVEVPNNSSVTNTSYTFAISLSYEWTP